MYQEESEVEHETEAECEGTARSVIKKLHFVTYFAGINELHCHFPQQPEPETFQTGPKHCQAPRLPAQKQLFFITPELSRSSPTSPELVSRPASSLSGLDSSSRYDAGAASVARRRHTSSTRRKRDSLSPPGPPYFVHRGHKRLSGDRSSKRSKRGNLSKTASNPGMLEQDTSPLPDSLKLAPGHAPMSSSSFESSHAPGPVTSVWSKKSCLKSENTCPSLQLENAETSPNQTVKFRKFRKEFVNKYGIKVTPPKGDEWVFKQLHEEKEDTKANKELAIKWGTPYPQEVKSMSSYRIAADSISKREKKGVKWRKRSELSRRSDVRPDMAQGSPDKLPCGSGRRERNCVRGTCFLKDVDEQT